MSGYVDQTILAGDPKLQGNCWQAALASLLGLDLAEVPHFVQIDADTGWDYLAATNAWLAYRFGQVLRNSSDGEGPCLAVGRSPRGVQHVVLWRDGELLHDPHPSRDGIDRPHLLLRLVTLGSRP